jgi:hypothetical protein
MRACLFLVLLVGCATVPEKPLVASVQTTIVKVPVPVPCFKAEDLPRMPKTDCVASLSYEQKARCLDLDLREMQEYAVKAEVLLIACLDKPLGNNK